MTALLSSFNTNTPDPRLRDDPFFISLNQLDIQPIGRFIDFDPSIIEQIVRNCCGTSNDIFRPERDDFKRQQYFSTLGIIEDIHHDIEGYWSDSSYRMRVDDWKKFKEFMNPKPVEESNGSSVVDCILLNMKRIDSLNARIEDIHSWLNKTIETTNNNNKYYNEQYNQLKEMVEKMRKPNQPGNSDYLKDKNDILSEIIELKIANQLKDKRIAELEQQITKLNERLLGLEALMIDVLKKGTK